MPQPTSSSLHQNVPLQNLTVARMQRQENFIVRQMTTPIPVDEQSDLYYEYAAGIYNTIAMQPRGASEESAGSGWTLSTSTYTCAREAVHVDVDDANEDNADPQVAPSKDAAGWLANQVRMRWEQLWGTSFFTTGVWTTDVTGVAAGPTAGQTLQWDAPTSDPQACVQTYQATLQSLLGFEGNVFVAGADLHRTLLTNAAFRESTKYVDGSSIPVMRQKIAAYLGVEKYFVAGGFYNSAAEGQTAVLSQILDADDGWLGYVDPQPGLQTLSAFHVFAWKGGPKYGSTSEGIVTRTIPNPLKTSVRYEVESFVDMKKIAADAGVFFDELTA